MRLAFHYHSPAIQAGSHIKTPSYIGVFIDSLAAEVEEVICFMHSPRSFEVSAVDYTLKAKNVRLVNIGVHSALPVRLLSTHKYRKVVREHSDLFDVMLIRTPTPLTMALTKAHKKPVVYYVVGDYVEGAKTLTLPAWKTFLVKSYAAYFNRKLLKVIKSRTMAANSQLLYNQLKDQAAEAHLVKSTTLTGEDIFAREDSFVSRKNDEPVNILFTGRITPSKGLEDVLTACGKLIESEGLSFHFHIAGMIDKGGESFIDRLKKQSAQYADEPFVTFYGKLNAGEQLNGLYRKCHIFTIASRGDFEGFPRVLWEAMANSLPVLATTVGSIPYFLESEKHALLVPPNDPDAFAEGLRKIIKDEDFRKKLIVNGRELAAINTLEQRAKDMVKILESAR
ncbi:MAG: glycosyltransferase [Cyclobacteriaceae bacterium]